MKNVKFGSRVYTDMAVTYDHLEWKYQHEAVNHADTYVKSKVHTNGLENFWSLMKRNFSGTYVSVEAVPSGPLLGWSRYSASTIARRRTTR